jgi:hypothetical protein
MSLFHICSMPTLHSFHRQWKSFQQERQADALEMGDEEKHVELAALPVNPSCTAYGQVSRREGMATHQKWEREGTREASCTSGQPILHSLWSGK